MTILQLHDSVTRAARLTTRDADALAVLAAPEAIAVVTRHEYGTTVTHVIATRDDLLAEQVIEGDAHHVRTGDADHAALLLLDRSGFVDADVDVTVALGRAVDVTLTTFRRASELAFAKDRRRARAALVAEGVPTIDAHELVDALVRGRVEVSGLAADGRRFVGCDFAVAGDAHTGRWLVPSSPHAEASLGAHTVCRVHGGNVRVRIERVGAGDLREELALVFGEV